jgi:peptidoglycan hydrolase-like protein with peptidoglycan-binding domain
MPYRVRQLGRPDAQGTQRNVSVSDLESLTTHHPGRNASARLVDGVAVNAENADRRSYGVIGGEFQELQSRRTDRSYDSIADDQILIVKDFILDDMSATHTRRVDVPSPVAGVIGRVDAGNGVVDILNPGDERLVARIRHLGPIAVAVGDVVAYGQSLGTQNNIGLPKSAGKHVHIEMDTGHYQQLDHYIRDLAEGRLAVQAEHRVGVEARPVIDDGVARVGEAGERVADVQRALVAGGYRAVGDAPIATDGIYRLSLQGAVLQFQEDHGIPASGDICAETWRTSLDLTLGKPAMPPPVVDDPRMSPVPRGHEALLQQIRRHLGALDVDPVQLPGVERERLTHGLLHLAAERDLRCVDHVLLGAATADAPAGTRLFLVQGRLDDPAHRRACVSTADALAMGDSLQRSHVPSHGQHDERLAATPEVRLQQSATMAHAPGGA